MNGHHSNHNQKPYLPLSCHLISAGHTSEDLNKFKVTIKNHNAYWTKDENMDHGFHIYQSLKV